MRRLSIANLTLVVGAICIASVAPASYGQEDIEDLGTQWSSEAPIQEVPDGGRSREVLVPVSPQPILAYYSEPLGAAFVIRWFRLRGKSSPARGWLATPIRTRRCDRLGFTPATSSPGWTGMQSETMTS